MQNTKLLMDGLITCSALERSYRDIIIGNRPGVTLVYLKGSYDLIRRRMAARHEHFMPVALLHSQFATLQEPTPNEHPITMDVGGRPTDIAAEIVHQLEERQVAVDVMNLHRGWRQLRRQESDNDTPGERNSELAFRG
jgi:carbohydrate kinase (thermoresistant glucokinase family)